MATLNESLKALMDLEGAMCCSIVDYTSGMVLGNAGSGLDMDLAAAGNTEVVRAKMKTAKSLGLDGSIEDMLITLSSQIHIIRPMKANPGLFIYFVLDKAKSNLALARRKVLDVEANIKM